MRARAASTALLLSLLFLIVYPGCNWITSLRSGVGTWRFEWEKAIPFVPIMIVPYMSLDLFFLAGPFLCRDERERAVLARRITFVILAGGACFLLLPLRLAGERPRVEGWLGFIWQPFTSMDRPFNLFPSLHITLRTILADLYGRRFRGAAGAALQVWFVLIGLSTVLTWQHHLVDVAGGFALAVLCFYLFPDSPAGVPGEPNRRVGGYYAAGAAAALALSALVWPWGALFLWPALSLGLMAAAYFWLGPGIFRKREGRLPVSTRFVLGPLLAGQFASLLYYSRRSRPWDEIAPGVILGRVLGPSRARKAIAEGVTAVLDLTAEFSEARLLLALRYRNLPVLDLTAPTQEVLSEAADWIEREAGRGRVLVHCKAGYSRSAAAVGAWLLRHGRASTAEEAVAALRQARAGIVVRPEAVAALRAFAAHLGSGRAVETGQAPR